MSPDKQVRGLRAMLEARSVAVVGASERKGSSGRQMIHQLVAGGFDGRVAPVNPRYEILEGHPCFPSLTAVPWDVDLAVLGVPNSGLEDELKKVAELGIPAAVIFASGYEGDAGDRSLVDRLTKIARDNDVTVCGGNCMGFANFDRSLRALAFEEDEGLESGPITWLTHSGSAFTALLHNDRHLRFNLAVSAGQEMTTSIADYLQYAVALPSTGVIALFLETVRDPDGFRRALMSASDAGIPIVALKVGRTAQSRELVTAHSGALAGEDAVFDALFDAHGVISVRSMNEMADVLELLAAGRQAGSGGLGSVHDSGGERAHFIDVATDVGIELAAISDKTRSRLAGILEPGLPPVNPVDAWGTGNDFESIFLECFRALDQDEAVGALSMSVDLAGEDLEWGYADVAEQLFNETSKPFAVLSNLSSAIDREAADRLRSSGVPVLEDTASGLRAFKHLLELRDHRELPPIAEGAGTDSESKERWSQRLRQVKLSEVEVLQMLNDYGIATAPSREVSTRDEASAAAEELGFPVALKITGRDHKTEAGGVVLSLPDVSSLISAYDDLSTRDDSRLLVQAMARPGVEIALGVVRDPQFGPVVAVAAGGTYVEMMRDSSFGVPPLDEVRARRMLERLQVRQLLDGFRGSPPADVSALVQAIVRLSVLAEDQGEHIEALDVNPVVVSPQGAVAVDGLVVPRAFA